MMKKNNSLLFGGAIAAAAFLFFGTSSAAAAPGETNIKVPVHYSLNADQIAHLMKLNPIARDRFYNFIRYVQETLGWDVIITSSYRTFQEQIKQYAENHHNAIPGHSFHNYGLAIDINLVKGNKRIKKASPKADWIATGVVDAATKFGLTWGGTAFSTYYDPVHFDMKKFYTSDQLQKKAIEQFGSLQNAKGNEVVL